MGSGVGKVKRKASFREWERQCQHGGEGGDEAEMARRCFLEPPHVANQALHSQFVWHDGATWTLDGGQWLASRPGMHWTGGWLGLSSSLDDMQRTVIPYRGQKQLSPGI